MKYYTFKNVVDEKGRKVKIKPKSEYLIQFPYGDLGKLRVNGRTIMVYARKYPHEKLIVLGVF